MEISKRHNPYDEYENFITAQMEAAAECIPTKPRAKCRILWVTSCKEKKWENLEASLLNKRNPTNAITQKLKKAQRELTYTKKSN